MRTSGNRLARLVASGALLALPLAACAAVGGGGDEGSDCESDVSGSELTPVATAAYDTEGSSCNNNEFVSEDLDAYAYPPAPGLDPIDTYRFLCGQEVGEGATWELFQRVDGVPQSLEMGTCQDGPTFGPASPGDEFVVVIEHPSSSESAEFMLSVFID